MVKPLIRYQDVYRDAIQSLLGTNPSAQEIIDAYAHAHQTGAALIQTGGGTFFDIFARKGRDEWEEVEKIITHFGNLGVRQSALIRGDFLVGYEPQPFDVIKAFVREYARMGMNVLQNFHGLNYTPALAGVAEAVRQVRAEEGHDIIAQGTICIEENRNITIDSCLRTAQALVDMGHTGFYLKSASGVVEPEFIHELTDKLLANFDQEIGVHVHSTYGKAPVCYMAAIEAAIARGRPMTIDVQHPAMAGSTAHPSIFKMQQIIENHPVDAVRRNAPVIDGAAIQKDMDSLFALRFRYREYEAPYNHDLLNAMRDARAAGGASATLAGVPGLKENLARSMGTNDWNAIQIEIYRMQAKILSDLGDPTQVTPYAANTTGQAAISLHNILNGKKPFDTLYPGIINYLTGRHGPVPETVNPNLVRKALAAAGLDAPVAYLPAQEKPPALESMKDKLHAAGLVEPTDRQALSLAIAGPAEHAKRIAHIIACENGTNIPASPPALPAYATVRRAERSQVSAGKGVRTFGPSSIVAAIGGTAALQKLAEQALHLKQIDDKLYAFPPGMADLEREWRDALIEKIDRFIVSLPKQLQDAGCPEFRDYDPNAAQPRLGALFRLAHLSDILRDASDMKGAGNYDHMVEAIRAYESAAPRLLPRRAEVILYAVRTDTPAPAIA